MKKRAKLWIKKHKRNFLFPLFMIFPFIIIGLYALPVSQHIAVESGDLLSYYGVIFGIVGSFYVYRKEKEKSDKERSHELKPAFVVDVKQAEHNPDIFDIAITNLSQNKVSYLYFYDEFISAEVQEKYHFKVTFNKSSADMQKIKCDYNITYDSSIIGADGFPQYVQLICDDRDGNDWDCCFHKVNDCGKIYYYPDDFEII